MGVDAGLSSSRIPRLVVPVSGRSGLAAAVRYGADTVVLDGRTGYDSNAAGTDVTFGIVRPNAFFDAIDFCRSRAVDVRLAMVGSFPVRRFADILDLAAALAEMGLGAVELSDPGLAAAFEFELPDIEIVYAGGPVGNAGTAAVLAHAGFGTIVFDSTVSCADVAVMGTRAGVRTEMPVFGLRPVSWCRDCLLGEYFDGVACRGSAFGPCRRVYTTGGGTAGGRLLEAGFFGGLLALPDMIRAGVGTIRAEVAGRRARVVGDVTSVFREALDAATRAMGDAGTVELGPGMYPAHALTFWNGRLVAAAMHGDVTPTGAGWRQVACPGTGRQTIRCGVASRIARFSEPVGIEMEDRAWGVFGGGEARHMTDLDGEVS